MKHLFLTQFFNSVSFGFQKEATDKDELKNLFKNILNVRQLLFI